MPPFSLNPTDRRSIEFMRELFSELLPHFSSTKFNVGCDETWDVGRGRSAGAVEEPARRLRRLFSQPGLSGTRES